MGRHKADRKTAEGVLWQLTPPEVRAMIRYLRRMRWRKLKRRLWTKSYREKHGV